ncbi:ankyrin repeat-containing protein NPR4-like isoform X1 [Senna tora]|uniref:Ankyrin repeat-containing protein NPR4-like isoform X1 n=1 Tax=Senna tora TaxID=362788 RepID=A0A834W1T0_9FABA|nr:ankyrin repeat-containing protein NPR4-like isoform X1 [Senna tora]
MGQDEAYDTRKPPKKFQGNPTCARPNHRWTTTWIAVGRRPPKINHSWVNFFSRQNLTCICRVKMIPMTQGSLPRSFKAIRVGRPVVDRVDRRPPKINHPWGLQLALQHHPQHITGVPATQLQPQPQSQFLYKSIRENNWNATKAFMEAHPNALGARISDTGQIALHFAASFGHVRMVEELVGLMEPQYLEKVDVGGFTPLAAAACNSGHLRIAQCMVNKNCNILAIPIKDRNLLPVTLALSHGHNEMGHYLYSLTPLELLKAENRIQGVRLLYWCFRMGELAREGNAEFVVELSKASPPLIQCSTDNLWSIFFYAIECRQAEVFSLIHGLRFKHGLATSIDRSKNTMLHVAANLAPSSKLNRISGPAFQMQSELQWFKEVENVVPQGYRVHQNFDGMQAEDLFKENHTKLRKEGEKWMKETASSCSVVGALVVTIMFATAFTVPGGDNQDSGVPVTLFVLLQFPLLVQMISSTYGPGMFKRNVKPWIGGPDILEDLSPGIVVISRLHSVEGIKKYYNSMESAMYPKHTVFGSPNGSVAWAIGSRDWTLGSTLPRTSIPTKSSGTNAKYSVLINTTSALNVTGDQATERWSRFYRSRSDGGHGLMVLKMKFGEES